MEFISKVKNELKRTNFVNDAFVFLEKNYISKEFHGAAKYGETINEFYSIEEKSQIGVQLSAKIFSAFYSFLKYEANLFFERKESFLRVVTERNIHENESYDLILKDIITNEIEKIETNDNFTYIYFNYTSNYDDIIKNVIKNIIINN